MSMLSTFARSLAGAGVGAAEEVWQGQAEAERNSSDPGRVEAQLLRDRWGDYQRRFVPREDELIAAYQSPEIRTRMLTEASTRTGQAFDVAEGIYGRTLSRITPAQDATEQAETSRLFGMNRTLAQVDARNRTRRGLIEQDQAILAGGRPA